MKVEHSWKERIFHSSHNINISILLLANKLNNRAYKDIKIQRR